MRRSSLVPNNEIWYTTTNGQPIKLSESTQTETVSNTYIGGKGIIVFRDPVVAINFSIFRGRKELREIVIPTSVTNFSNMKCDEAIATVLAEKGKPMSTEEITKKIERKGYFTTNAEKAENSVNSYLTRNERRLFRKEHLRDSYTLAKSSILPLYSYKTTGRTPIVVRPSESYSVGDKNYKHVSTTSTAPSPTEKELTEAKKLLEPIVNFRLPLVKEEVCFADILDNLEIEISNEKEPHPQSVDTTVLQQKLKELQKLIKKIEGKVNKNPERLNEDYAPLEIMRQVAEKAKGLLNGNVDNVTLLGEFVSASESKPKVVIYYENIKKMMIKGSSEDSLNVMAVMAGVFVHEMFHAWNYIKAGKKQRSVLEIDEPMVEFAALYFLKKLEAYTDSYDSPYHYLQDKVSTARTEIAKIVKDKQLSIGEVAAYGFGHFLYESLSDADSIDWIETYSKKSASIIKDCDVVKDLTPIYPFTYEEEVMDRFYDIIFDTLTTLGKSPAAKTGSDDTLRKLALACIDLIGRKCFDANEFHAFKPIFEVCFPTCKNLMDVLKQQLDELVKDGILEALPDDCYYRK